MRTQKDRGSVRSDPRNTARQTIPHLRASFWVVALIVAALALTAVLFWVRG